MTKTKATGERKPPLVLLVDDFPDNRQMYAEYLAFAGLRVAEAENGHEAVQQATTLMPDLVVMDLSLPGMDGWEATRRLKSHPKTKHILVMALTGHALAGHSKGAIEAGCDAFITKPCLPDRLLQEIQRMLTSSKKSKSGG
jgi:CheY-like chemotaxis protein